jgi:hypothetical protein
LLNPSKPSLAPPRERAPSANEEPPIDGRWCWAVGGLIAPACTDSSAPPEPTITALQGPRSDSACWPSLPRQWLSTTSFHASSGSTGSSWGYAMRSTSALGGYFSDCLGKVRKAQAVELPSSLSCCAPFHVAVDNLLCAATRELDHQLRSVNLGHGSPAELRMRDVVANGECADIRNVGRNHSWAGFRLHAYPCALQSLMGSSGFLWLVSQFRRKGRQHIRHRILACWGRTVGQRRLHAIHVAAAIGVASVLLGSFRNACFRRDH